VIGELGHASISVPYIKLVPGTQWLRAFYDISDGVTNHRRFWSAASVHPYQAPSLFDPAVYADDAESVRAVMRAHDDTAQLWNTEFDCGGSDTLYPWYVDSLQSANSLCKAFTSTPAQAGLPGGTFDRIGWWKSCAKVGYGDWGLFASNMRARPGYFAFKQVIDSLTGKRFNRTVGGTETDARTYEFEDTTTLRRTWVCWQGEAVPAFTPVPVRNDEVNSVALAYDGSPPADQKAAENSGWLHLRLDQRPVFVTETGVASRPELVADSFWTTPTVLQRGLPVTFHTRVKNRDLQDSTPQGCSTWVRFWWNDSVITSACTTKVLGPGETMTLSKYDTVPSWMFGPGLLKADANPGMLYVEKEGTDDNQVYLRLNVP
jgi:hypothetical protein